MPPVGFEPTISAGERPKTYALDLAGTGTGFVVFILYLNQSLCCTESLRRKTRELPTPVAQFIDFGGGIFEHL
jgi:hypothetical protein